MNEGSVPRTPVEFDAIHNFEKGETDAFCGCYTLSKSISVQDTWCLYREYFAIKSFLKPCCQAMVKNDVNFIVYRRPSYE